MRLSAVRLSDTAYPQVLRSFSVQAGEGVERGEEARVRVADAGLLLSKHLHGFAAAHSVAAQHQQGPVLRRGAGGGKKTREATYAFSSTLAQRSLVVGTGALHRLAVTKQDEARWSARAAPEGGSAGGVRAARSRRRERMTEERRQRRHVGTRTACVCGER